MERLFLKKKAVSSSTFKTKKAKKKSFKNQSKTKTKKILDTWYLSKKKRLWLFQELRLSVRFENTFEITYKKIYFTSKVPQSLTFSDNNSSCTNVSLSAILN